MVFSRRSQEPTPIVVANQVDVVTRERVLGRREPMQAARAQEDDGGEENLSRSGIHAESRSADR